MKKITDAQIKKEIEMLPDDHPKRRMLLRVKKKREERPAEIDSQVDGDMPGMPVAEASSKKRRIAQQ